MHRMDIFSQPADDDPSLHTVGSVLRGLVSSVDRENGTRADTATSVNDEINVRIPSYDMARAFGPFKFSPQAGNNGRPILPMRDDNCLVSFDEDGQPQLVAWWTDDDSDPVTQVYTVTAGYTKDRSFNPETAATLEVARVLGSLIDDLKSSGFLP